MEKTIFSKKHTILKISLVLVLMLFAFSFAITQAMGISAKAALSEEDYGFEINTGEGFLSGTYIRVTDNVYPTFSLTFNNQNLLEEKIFWYGVADSSNIDEVDNWVMFDQDDSSNNPPYNPSNGVGTLYLADIVPDIAAVNGGIYHKYMFFRSGALPVPGVEETGVSYYYHDQVVEVCIDNNASDAAYKIDSLSATCQIGGMQTAYDLTSSEKVWVSSPITLTVTNGDGEYDNANFYYQLEGYEPVKFQKVALSEEGGVSTYQGEAKIPDPESGIVSYEGKITVYSTSFADPDTHYVYDTADLNVYYDGEEPRFTVKATTTFGGKVIDYAEGSWASDDITYVITPDGDGNASGATYYYSAYTTGGDVQSGPIQAQGDELTYVVSQEGITSVTFSASSGANVTYTAPATQARIDTTRPDIAVNAVDGKGAEIRTMGTAPNSGYRVGYASNSITFTVTNKNQASQQIGNNIQYFYSFDGVEYKKLETINNNNQLRQNNTDTEQIVDKTYYFKIVSDSGYEDIYTFTASVLDSNYYTLMEVEELHPNGAGWLKDEVNVYFTVPQILGIENEYEIHGLVTGDTSTDKVLPLTVVSGAPQGYIKYNAKIDTNLNESSYTFYVLDKANNRVDYNTDESGNPMLDENGNELALRTTQLKLDLTNPSAEVVSTINGTDIVIAESEWSAGEVLITITPQALISGVNCYPMIGENPSLTPMTMANGAFTKIVAESGVYSFRLVSGAGRQTTISCTVNIDVSAIVLDEIIVSTIDKSGAIIKENIGTKDVMVANDLLVSFETNHQGHFVFYYAEYTGTEPNLSESDYTLYVPQEGQDAFSMVIKMPEEGGNGFVNYAFMLRSMAMDTNGNVSQSEVKYISIQYDVRDFDIEVNYSGLGAADQWVGIAPQFSLGLHQNATEGIKIAKYQYRLNLDGEWTDIDEAIGSDNKVSFTFKGVKNYVNDEERLDSTQSDESYASFNGTIYFRALNEAGHSSRSLSYIVKLDTSTPNPLYAISQKAGEKVYDSTQNYYVLYSNQAIKYIPTGTEGIFGQKAPITYFYRLSTGLSDTSSNIDENTWSRLNGEVTLANGSYYWLYADNGLHRSVAYKVYIQIEESAPTAEIVSGGSIGAQEGVLEFNWTNRAEIQFKITSSTGVYIWYSLDGSEWMKVSETLVPVSGTNFQRIAFVPPAEGGSIGEDFTIVGNLKQTARFKITNLSGSEYEVVNSVIIRIDNEEPEFDVSLSSASMPVITETDLASRWFSEAINVKIIPVGYNPGGVEYTYKVVGVGNYEKFAGTRFSTDNIVDFSGNGEVKVLVRAIASANLKTYERELTFKIDKVAPEFELMGEIKKGGVTTGKIVSGDWTNADEVLVSKVPSVASVSGVTYELLEPNKGSANWNDNSPKSYKEITSITVIATSGAGVKVTKTFQVNIDNIAPIINAGPIVNNVDDPRNPYRYYIDQVVTYEEANLKSAKYNNFPLSNGHIIATNTVDNSNGGYVHIVVEDLAGNKAELTFYMTIFDLTVNTIELNDSHVALLSEFEASYNDAKAHLTDSRSQYFATLIGRLWDRLATLEKEIADYQAYLTLFDQRKTFDLISDYPEMEKYLAYFISEDPLIVYPKWQQDKIKEGEYAAIYADLVTEYNKLDAQMTVVRNLQKEVVALPATNIVEEGDYQNVIRVYNAYQSLGNDQKAVFKSTLYTKLVELKRICEVYLLQDEDTGISIDGDHLVGESIGVMLEVVSYQESTELFKNAQKTLYETITEGNPRKIISINKLGLTGYGSQYDTGEITITLPIPNEGEIDYTQYVYFAVYRLSTDGTMSPVTGVMRARDGKSVYFNSTTLDTYVLATTANVVVREDPETIYGSVGGIEIDAKLLTYITFAVIAMFAVFVVLMLLVALRRRKFLRAYNRDHKNSLQRRGITRIPKGNAPPPSNPARPEERVGDTHAVYYRGRRK